jgi:prevent-host-death family protein
MAGWLHNQLARRTMKQVDALEARNKLDTLLDTAEGGEEVLITRHGKAVAKLVPAQPRVDPEAARAAGRRIREQAERLKPKVTLEEIKEWIHEGRP